MAQSLAQIYLHIVFSTKNRVPFIKDEKLCKELHGYLIGICKNMDSPSLQIGGVENHVHILCRFSRKLMIMSLVGEMKKSSSKWIKKKDSSLSDFHWQDGYGAFSVSPSHVMNLQKYIADQKVHHYKETFQDEFRRILKKYGVSYNEKYVWD